MACATGLVLAGRRDEPAGRCRAQLDSPTTEATARCVAASYDEVSSHVSGSAAHARPRREHRGRPDARPEAEPARPTSQNSPVAPEWSAPATHPRKPRALHRGDVVRESGPPPRIRGPASVCRPRRSRAGPARGARRAGRPHARALRAATRSGPAPRRSTALMRGGRGRRRRRQAPRGVRNGRVDERDGGPAPEPLTGEAHTLAVRGEHRGTLLAREPVQPERRRWRDHGEGRPRRHRGARSAPGSRRARASRRLARPGGAAALVAIAIDERRATTHSKGLPERLAPEVLMGVDREHDHQTTKRAQHLCCLLDAWPIGASQEAVRHGCAGRRTVREERQRASRRGIRRPSGKMTGP